jgi:hypothetical protein
MESVCLCTLECDDYPLRLWSWGVQAGTNVVEHRMPVACPLGLVAKLFEFRVGADALNDCLRGRNERGHIKFAVRLNPNLRVAINVGSRLVIRNLRKILDVIA